MITLEKGHGRTGDNAKPRPMTGRDSLFLRVGFQRFCEFDDLVASRSRFPPLTGSVVSCWGSPPLPQPTAASATAATPPARKLRRHARAQRTVRMRTPESDKIQTLRLKPRFASNCDIATREGRREAGPGQHVLMITLASRKNSQTNKTLTNSSSKCKHLDQIQSINHDVSQVEESL